MGLTITDSNVAIFWRPVCNVITQKLISKKIESQNQLLSNKVLTCISMKPQISGNFREDPFTVELWLSLSVYCYLQ